ncbi:MAG: hypothetical protein IPL22_20225 [Bacteroidetes bacterium]|nr:hypothetical protein [Bacteroidota bacterium]
MLEKFQSLTKVSQRLIIVTSVLLLYGYLCRLLGLYFFWESKYIGWTLVAITVIFLLRERISFKKTQGKKTTSEKVGIGLMIFVFVIQSVLLVVTPKLDSYKIARQYLQIDKSVSKEVGEVTSIMLIPMGGFSSQTSSTGTTGQADLNFIGKGKEKFKDYNIQVVKPANSDWTIVNNK